MPVGKRNEYNVHLHTKRKTQELPLLGFSLCSFVIAFPIEPFANIVGCYTCFEGNKKRYNVLHLHTPSLLPD